MKTRKFFSILCGLLFLTAMQVQAQGVTWQNAKLLTSGQNVSGSLSATTNLHWYKITLTGNSAAEFIIQTDNVLSISTLTLYVIDDNPSNIRNELNLHGNPYGKFNINDLAAGTYYMRVARWENYNSGTYTLSYKVTTPEWPDDPEPNNTWDQAVELENNSSVTGHLGFWYFPLDDRDEVDWYKITLTGNSAAEFTIQTDGVLMIHDLYLYAADGDTIAPWRRNEKWGRTYYVEFNINDLAAGTYYLRVARWENYNCGTYTLSYKVTMPEWPDDPEPNDTWDKAVELEHNSTVTGHLGFWHLGYGGERDDVDNFDWYKFTLTGNSASEFIIQTDGVLMIHDLYLYAADGDTIAPWIRNEKWGRTYYIEFNINDLAAGTYYLRVWRSNYYGAYTLSFKVTTPEWPDDPEPNDTWDQAVELEHNSTVTGHLGFWHLGYGGERDDVDNFDWYKFTLTGNSAVEFTIQSDSVLIIHDLYLYAAINNTTEPWKRNEKWGRTYYVEFNINDLEAGTYYLRVWRSNYYGAYTLNFNVIPGPKAEFSYIRNLNTVSFVNRSLYADSLKWDFGDGTVNTSNQRNPVHTYSGPGYYPAQLTAFSNVCTLSDMVTHYFSVRGIQRVESNRGGNGDNVTISVIGGGMKENAQVKLRRGATEITAFETFTPNLGKVDATFNLSGAELGLYDVVVQNPGESVMELADAFTIEEAVQPNVWVDIQGTQRVIRGRTATYTVLYGNTGNIDALNRIIWIVTPDDPAQITFTDIDFNAPELYDADVWQLIRQNDLKPYLKSTDIDPAATPARYYGICVPTVPANSEKSFTFKVLYTEDFDIQVFHTYGFLEDEVADGSNNMRSENSLRAAAGDFNDCLVMKAGSFFVNGVVDLIPFAGCARNIYSNFTGNFPKINESNRQTALFRTLSTAWSCGKEFIPGSSVIKLASVVLDAGFNLVNTKNEFEKECGKFKNRGIKKHGIAVRNSFDPNEKQGPSGYGAENHVAQRVFPYTILFENKNTATAAAQEVVIIDTLDIQKFDLSTFRFKEFGFSENRYTALQDGTDFVQNIDLRPGKNAVLRVTGVLDDNIVTWRFLTLDPRTMDLTEDVDAGFLPPNVNSPEGEGFVSFVVSLKETVGSGAVINNFADIVFDVNEPIRTDVFSNKIDEIAPTSRVVSANYIDGELEITFTGTDPGGAGIRFYDLFVSTNGGEFEQKFKNISGNTFRYLPSKGVACNYYSIATDSLGYRENAKSAGEVSVYTGIKTIKKDALQVYPNPVKDEVFIKSELSVRKMEICDLSGRIVETQCIVSPQNGALKINLSALPQGVYMLKIYTDSGVEVKKVVKK